MTEYKRQPKEDVCHLLQSVILQICEEHYQSRGDVEVDAIICLSTLDSESQDVVKIHKVLPSGNRRSRPERTSLDAKIKHSRKLKNTKQQHFKRNSYLSRYPRKQYNAVHITNDHREDLGDTEACSSQIEYINDDVENNLTQNVCHVEGEELSKEASDEHHDLDNCIDFPKERKMSTDEIEQNNFIPNQTEEERFAVSDVSTIKIEPRELTNEQESETNLPNFSSRPKRKQNPKRIIRLHDSQNHYQNDTGSFESETEEQYSNLTPKEEFVEEKQVVEDSGDTDEFQLWSAQIKSELYSHNPEEDEDLFGETESNQDNVDMETRHSSPGQVETPPRKVLKLENKRVTQSLRHSESKVFQCSKCGSGFSSKKSQMRHERYNCGDIPHFECNVCGKFYSRADSKTRHLWKIHGIKISTPDKNNPTDFP